MRPEPTPNLLAIATEAGVSRMTVSRALRNARGVDPATREKILEAVKKLGWRPNPMVSAFMSYVRTKRTESEAGVLAYLTNHPTRDGWRSLEGFLRFHEGAAARAASRGYRLEEFWLRERGMTGRRLSEVLYARGIRGIVVSPMVSSHGHLNMDWDKFSAAAIGYSLLKPLLSRATNDQYGTMLLALRELRRLGYERIALVMPHNDDSRVYYHWSAGFLSHHWRYHQNLKPILHTPMRWRDDAAISWFRKARSEVIVTTSSHFLNRMVKAGIDIPGDVGFVNLDWSKSLGHYSGVDQLEEEVGGAAVDIVVDQINKNESGVPHHPRTVLVAGKWVPGATVRNLKDLVPARRAKLRKKSAVA